LEILKQLREDVRRRSELCTNDWILHHNSAPAHKTLSVQQFRAKKSITEMEHPSCLATNDFWLLPKIKPKGTKISGFCRHSKECNDGTESYCTRVPKMFPTVAASMG
jgi:hypothetical protein